MRTVLFVGGLCLLVSVGFLVTGCGSSESEAQAGPQTTCPMTGCGSSESEAQAGPQTTCPMMGTPINKKIFLDHKGKRVYFCCNNCPKSFRADADAQMKKMTDAGVILEDTPK